MSGAVQRRVTITDVAAAAGVSRTAVSVAFSGNGRVDKRTREHILKVAADLGYQPSVRAQRLRGGRSRTVGIASAMSDTIVGRESQMSFLFEIAVPMAHELMERGYSTLLIPPVHTLDQLRVIDADGVVVVDPRQADPLVSLFRSRDMQVVTVGEGPDTEADGVVGGLDASVDVAVSYLTGKGARKIGIIVSSHAYSGSAAVHAYVRQRSDMAEPPVVLAEASPEDGVAGGAAAARVLFAEHPEIDAVYASIDAFALGALTEARAAGRRVPEDMMVMTSFDGPRARQSDPPMTSLALDFPEIGQAAATLMLSRLDGNPDAPSTIRAPRPEVLERESTAR